MHSSPSTVTLLPPSRRNAHTNSASVFSEVKALIVFVEVQYRQCAHCLLATMTAMLVLASVGMSTALSPAGEANATGLSPFIGFLIHSAGYYPFVFFFGDDVKKKVRVSSAVFGPTVAKSDTRLLDGHGGPELVPMLFTPPLPRDIHGVSACCPQL